MHGREIEIEREREYRGAAWSSRSSEAVREVGWSSVAMSCR